MNKKIYEMHREKRMSVAQISKELKMSKFKVARSLFPDGYEKGDLVRCEYCGEFFNPKNGESYVTTCSPSCGRRFSVLLKTNLDLPKFEGLMKMVKSATEVPDSDETKTEKVWDDYLGEYIDVPIVKYVVPNKKLCETVNKARDARKSYGIYIADEDHKKANEKYFAFGLFDDSFQQYIDAIGRR